MSNDTPAALLPIFGSVPFIRNADTSPPIG